MHMAKAVCIRSLVVSADGVTGWSSRSFHNCTCPALLTLGHIQRTCTFQSSPVQHGNQREGTIYVHVSWHARQVFFSGCTHALFSDQTDEVDNHCMTIVVNWPCNIDDRNEVAFPQPTYIDTPCDSVDKERIQQHIAFSWLWRAVLCGI